MLRRVRVIENRFTWSKSRAETFDECLRKYWWTYYGSWGGWSADAGGEAREAYLLKNLHSRWTWVGQVVHRAIEGILRSVHDAGREGTLALDAAHGFDAAREVDGVTAAMRAQWRDSRDGRYRADPKRVVGLLEHEYRVPVADAEWKDIHARAVAGVRAFLASPVFERIRATDPATWLPFETLDSFEFEGVPVWAALDFAMRTPGGAEVFDWKTGEDRVDENRLQLLCYALYVQARHAVPAERVTCHLVYLNTGTVHDFRPTLADLELARETIRASIARMRGLLRPGAVNEAAAELFPMTDDVARCAGCSFRRLCGR
jgi:hypothetical protein